MERSSLKTTAKGWGFSSHYSYRGGLVPSTQVAHNSFITPLQEIWSPQKLT